MINPEVFFGQLPEIAPRLLDVLGDPEIIPVYNSGGERRLIGEEVIVGRLAELGKLTTNGTMFIGGFGEDSGAEKLLRCALIDGACMIIGMAQVDPNPFSEDKLANLSRAAQSFLPLAIRQSIEFAPLFAVKSERKHIQDHAESYTALLPFTGFRLRRHIKKQLIAA